ncbi:MAG: hypothetical protein V7L27_10310 [Nostoc sp.]|uniref:hypothetical protein n=1 Tax=Nostoc sp. TaxID=1180 RepID=UPI002FF65AA3
MALRKDTALDLTGSQPPGWEPILGGSASSSLTRGSSPFEYIPSLEPGNEVTQAFGLFLVPFISNPGDKLSLRTPSENPQSTQHRGANAMTNMFLQNWDAPTDFRIK